MASNSNIAWTDHTFNIAWGCVKISPGCTNCYADSYANTGPRAYKQDGDVVGIWGEGRPRRVFGDRHWKQPLRWQREAEAAGRIDKVFCSSMTDWALDDPYLSDARERLWPIIRSTKNLHWQLLTKRPENILRYLPDDFESWSNIWIGTSIENNDYTHRADQIRSLPVPVRFISYEPALGPLDELDLTGIDWIIYGGESGNQSNNYRKEDKQWARDMRKRCADHSPRVAFFHKQSAGFTTETGTKLDGAVVKEYPAPRKPAKNGTRVRVSPQMTLF